MNKKFPPALDNLERQNQPQPLMMNEKLKN